MKFYIGVGQQSQIMWVNKYFMLSYQVCRRLKNVWGIPDKYEWIMDSGAFSEIKKHGKYTYTPEEYMETVELWQPDYFVNMDWMCEPSQLDKTGKTIEEHHNLSLENQIHLKELLEDSWMNQHVELMGVVQGWKPSDYVKHVDLLKTHDLIEPYMGIGSVCRRGQSEAILKVIRTVHEALPDVRLHGFGVKTTLLKNIITYDCLDSVDSQAWCMAGWRGCPNEHGESMLGEPCLIHEWKHCFRDTDDCANCGRYMIHWLEKNQELIDFHEHQQRLPEILVDTKP